MQADAARIFADVQKWGDYGFIMVQGIYGIGDRVALFGAIF